MVRANYEFKTLREWDDRLAPELSSVVNFEYDDLVTAVFRKVKDLILTQQLRPGLKIRQEELARTLGVSRTPIIKALHLLVNENLVTYTPRKGFTVKEFTPREMAEIFYVRELLDGAVARETARKATPEEIEELRGYFAEFRQGQSWDREARARYLDLDKAFHARLYEIGQVPLLQRINEIFSISIMSYQQGLIRDPNETLVEHLAIMEAIRNRDEESAERMARAHAIRTRMTLLRRLENS